MLTDEEVVVRVQAGEAELFELIFERHYARIERSVRGLGLPEADREDVVAETFTRAFAGIRCFDAASGTRYLAYLYAIARNLGADRLRQKRRAPEVASLDDDGIAEIPDESEHGAPLPALLKREQLDRIRAALAQLSPSDREIIALSYERDLSSKEIMEAMGKPSTTAVTTHLYKAMKKLRALVLADVAGEDQGCGEPDGEIGNARPMSAGRCARMAQTDNPACRRFGASRAPGSHEAKVLALAERERVPWQPGWPAPWSGRAPR